ncbi:glycoside hydrolase family 16 protein [Hymenopellis radicata]|nr:glycoside hydrolase family 16 protein [Hymenopellis radicata]
MSRLLKGYSIASYTSDSSTSSILPLSAPPVSRETRAGVETPYEAASKEGYDGKSRALYQKYSLAADPTTWGSNLNPYYAEADDALHNPTVRSGRIVDDDTHFSWSSRGMANLGCLLILCCGLFGFIVRPRLSIPVTHIYSVISVGYPLFTYRERMLYDAHTFNALGVNASGQVPVLSSGFSPIDPETPKDVYMKTSRRDGEQWQLVFSDEFNTEGRTFYPGDDPYWEAVDLNYWATGDLEWYDPVAVTTTGGAMAITLTRKETHGLHFQSGMVTTWNKFCFTGGYVEAAVQLPGANNVVGLWPAVWTMGNLGRAGYGASLEGMWPYSYDSCDVGTAPNQTLRGLPESSTTSGFEGSNFELSFLPGQRLSRCTCAGESHPGPVHSDGTYVGRSAPEIDILEATVTGRPLSGQVSQSGQWAPFNNNYVWDNSSANLIIDDPTISILNEFRGGEFQQSTSVVTDTPASCYQLANNPCFAVYGFEYKPGYDDAYIEWVSNDKSAWRLNAAGVGADTTAEISARPIPQEPMLWGTIDFEHLTFPAVMLIDYVRVYQDPKHINVGCDPIDFPTQSYINQYPAAYYNANLTTWVDDFGQPFPKNSLVNGCN